MKYTTKRRSAFGGSLLVRCGVLLLGLSACDALLGFHRGRLAPAGEAGSGGRGSGGRSASGGRGGVSGSGAEAGTTSDAGRGLVDSGGATGASAGRGAGGASAAGGSESGASAGTGSDTPVAGEGGHGGEAGGDPGPCRKDEDCPNPDPDCRPQCRSSAFGNTCVIVPADADGDLHGSAACEGAAVLGDDCDDTRDTVYKDAPELCDALDNDCDGKRDFDDGQELSGGPHVLAEAPVYDVDFAWSPSQMTWGSLWSTTSVTMYQPMDRTGGSRIEPVPVSDYLGSFGAVSAGDTTASAMLPRSPSLPTVAIAWGEGAPGTGAFAVAFPGWPDVVLGLVSADGASLVPAVPLSDTYGGWGSEGPAVEWLESQGVWAAAWMDLRDNTYQPIVRTVSLTGSFGPEAYPGVGSNPGLAVAGGQLAAVWDGFDTARGSLLTGGLEARPIDVSGGFDLEYPFIAGNTDRFGVVVSAPPDKFGYAEIGLDGTLICGPVLRDASGFVHSDIVAVEQGFLILAGQPTVQAVEVLPGCRFGSTIQIDSTPARFVRGASAGADGVVIAWGGADRPVQVQVMGPHLCD